MEKNEHTPAARVCEVSVNGETWNGKGKGINIANSMCLLCFVFLFTCELLGDRLMSQCKPQVKFH